MNIFAVLMLALTKSIHLSMWLFVIFMILLLPGSISSLSLPNLVILMLELAGFALIVEVSIFETCMH